MIPLPTNRDDSEDEEQEGAAAVWSFLLVLFFFKLATVILIFWHLRSWESGVILGATFWYWIPPSSCSARDRWCSITGCGRYAPAARRCGGRNGWLATTRTRQSGPLASGNAGNSSRRRSAYNAHSRVQADAPDALA